MARRDVVLGRDTNDKMIGGVCSGLGQYFDVDTTLVRVAFVVAAMLGGGGILGYAILWVVLDPTPAGHGADAIERPRTDSRVDDIDLVTESTTGAGQR